MTYHSKPSECIGCPLYTRGAGFAQPAGSYDSPLVLVGEALGKTEAYKSVPFVGDAGVYLNRALRRLGVERDGLLLGNTVSCQPPNDWLVGAPWEQAAVDHCHVHREKLYGHKVYLTMGVSATRTVLKEVLNIDFMGKLENWHGYVIGPPPFGPFVVPTFHPSYLLKGNHKLFGVLLRDLKRAMEVASYGIVTRSQPDLIVDPPLDWFTHFVDSVPNDPGVLMAVDIETTIKSGNDEDDLEVVGSITRINFAMHEDQGITVPWDERYRFQIHRLLANKTTKVFWNEQYDVPILARNGEEVKGTVYDGMWAWHLLQSSLPKGLGFVAPFYSDLLPWKHLASTEDEGIYAATDAVQQLRLMNGIAKDLKAAGQWESFLKYVVRLDSEVLHPATIAGIKLDKPSLEAMRTEIATEAQAIDDRLQTLIPEEVLPLSGGWKRKPKDLEGVLERVVKETVIVCQLCGAAEVGPAHKCSKESE